jgi:uncharacterized membrane protein
MVAKYRNLESYLNSNERSKNTKKEINCMILSMLWDIIVYLWTLTLNVVTFLGLIVAVVVLASIAAIPPSIMLWALTQVGLQ